MPPPIPPRQPNARPTEPAANTAGRVSRTVRVGPPPLPAANSKLILWMCLSTAVGVLIVVTGLGVYLVLSKSSAAVDLVASKSDMSDSSFEKPSSLIGQASEEPIPELERPVSRVDIPDKGPFLSPAVMTDETALPVSSTRGNGNPAAPDVTAVAFADLRRRGFQLELPGRGQLLDSTETTLAMLPLPANETLQLALSGGSASNIKLVRQTDSPPETQVWNAIKLADVGFGATEEATLGKFIHQAGELRFQWADAPPWAKAGSLQFVPLEITIGSTRQVCQLWKPITANPVRIKVDSTTTGVVPLTASMIDRPNQFRVEYQLVESGKTDRQSVTSSLGDTAKISLGNDQVEMELSLVLGDTQSSVQGRLFAEPRLIKKDVATKGPRQEINPTIIDEHLRQMRSKDPKKRESEINKLQAQSEKLQKLLDQKKSSQQDEQTGLEKQVDSINAKISKLETELATMQEAFNTNLEWYHATAGILQKLGEQTQLCFAVYTATEPRIVIIETAGFDWSRK